MWTNIVKHKVAIFIISSHLILGLHLYSTYSLFILPYIACHRVSYESFETKDPRKGPLAFAHTNR